MNVIDADMQDEVKERKREYMREYQQRPEVKERRREYMRECYAERTRTNKFFESLAFMDAVSKLSGKIFQKTGN